jgi:hypothetical protein
MTEEQRKLKTVIVLSVYSDGYISTIAINHPISVSVEREMINDSFDGITSFINGTRFFTLRIDYRD